MKQHFELLASYNKWMNEKIYEASATLSDESLEQDRGAFFGSILGTLNHIVVGDTLWLKRFAQHPSCEVALRQVVDLPTPKSLDDLLFHQLRGLRTHRAWLDEHICKWVQELSEQDLNSVLSYRNMKGVASRKMYSSLLLHFFNHQTHHRGQVSTLLSQAGVQLGVTDLLALVPEEENV